MTDQWPKSSRNTLLLIALLGEAQVSDRDPPCSKGILPVGCEPYWENDKSPKIAPQQAYCGTNLTIGLTGPQGHSFASVAMKLLLDNVKNGDEPFERMVNFGAVGMYPWSNGTQLKSAYFVSHARRWNETIPARGFEYYTEAAELAVPCLPEGEQAKVCLSSNRFSSDFDRQTHQMLDGDLEDFELYDMARIAQLIGLPFYSIKFVTNVTAPNGATEFFNNLADARTAGTEKLEAFLESDAA